jgi:hypothetical protein
MTKSSPPSMPNQPVLASSPRSTVATALRCVHQIIGRRWLLALGFFAIALLVTCSYNRRYEQILVRVELKAATSMPVEFRWALADAPGVLVALQHTNTLVDRENTRGQRLSRHLPPWLIDSMEARLPSGHSGGRVLLQTSRGRTSIKIHQEATRVVMAPQTLRSLRQQPEPLSETIVRGLVPCVVAACLLASLSWASRTLVSTVAIGIVATLALPPVRPLKLERLTVTSDAAEITGTLEQGSRPRLPLQFFRSDSRLFELKSPLWTPGLSSIELCAREGTILGTQMTVNAITHTPRPSGAAVGGCVQMPILAERPAETSAVDWAFRFCAFFLLGLAVITLGRKTEEVRIHLAALRNRPCLVAAGLLVTCGVLAHLPGAFTADSLGWAAINLNFFSTYKPLLPQVAVRLLTEAVPIPHVIPLAHLVLWWSLLARISRFSIPPLFYFLLILGLPLHMLFLSTHWTDGPAALALGHLGVSLVRLAHGQRINFGILVTAGIMTAAWRLNNWTLVPVMGLVFALVSNWRLGFSIVCILGGVYGIQQSILAPVLKADARKEPYRRQLFPIAVWLRSLEHAGVDRPPTAALMNVFERRPGEGIGVMFAPDRFNSLPSEAQVYAARDDFFHLATPHMLEIVKANAEILGSFVFARDTYVWDRGYLWSGEVSPVPYYYFDPDLFKMTFMSNGAVNRLNTWLVSSVGPPTGWLHAIVNPRSSVPYSLLLIVVSPWLGLARTGRARVVLVLLGGGVLSFWLAVPSTAELRYLYPFMYLGLLATLGAPNCAEKACVRGCSSIPCITP